MTKADVIQGLCDATNLTKKDAGAMLDALVGFITKKLQAGNEVVIQGFGKFTVKTIAARKGRNPRTGDPVDIPAKKKISFVPQKALKEAVQ